MLPTTLNMNIAYNMGFEIISSGFILGLKGICIYDLCSFKESAAYISMTKRYSIAWNRDGRWKWLI